MFIKVKLGSCSGNGVTLTTVTVGHFEGEEQLEADSHVHSELDHVGCPGQLQSSRALIGVTLFPHP